MSIEAMSKAYEALNKSRPFDADNARMQRDAMDALRTAIQQAEAKTDEPVAWLDEMLADTKEVFDANGTETPQVVRDVIEYVASWITVYNEKHRPAPGVPDDVARDAISLVREQYRGTDWGKAAECICDAIDTAMLATAAQAQKGQP